MPGNGAGRSWSNGLIFHLLHFSNETVTGAMKSRGTCNTFPAKTLQVSSDCMSGCHIEHIILLRATHRPAKTGWFFCIDVPKLGFKGQNSHRHRKISRFFCDDDAKCLPYPEYDSSTAFIVYGFRSSVNTSVICLRARGLDIETHGLGSRSCHPEHPHLSS